MTCQISPGTVAAIAASLMAQGMNLGEYSDIWFKKRPAYIKDFVKLAWEIAQETERQKPTETTGEKPHAQPKNR